MKKRKWLIAIITIVGLGLICLGVAGYYFYHMAVVPGHKSFLSNGKVDPNSPLYKEKQWYDHAKKYRWTQTSVTDNLKLDANYIKADHATKNTIVIAHGFMGNKDAMYPYAYLFHQLGYNVLLPDDRGHGQSEGNYIGYGWPDRLDYIKWIKRVVATDGADSKIALFGTSMGGATTMMVSGEKSVPKQVKVYIEDCGYTSVYDEIKYQAKTMYNLPEYPMVPIVSGINYLKNGYTFKQASALNQVKKNKKPMLFIHGYDDHFVPTAMVKQVYRADRGPKQLIIMGGKGHAASYEHNIALYTNSVNKFLKKYL